MTVRRSGPGAQRLISALRELDGVQGKTGWFETSKYADGTPVAMVAMVQEYGAVINVADAAASYQGGESEGRATIFIPPRPFMRPTVAEQGPAWMKLLGSGAASVLRGERTAREVLEIVTLKAAADVAKTISKVESPPLSPLTIARKGSKKPLIDTGQMFRDVTGIVEKAE